MAGNQRRDLGRVGLGQIVISARDDMQAGVGNARLEMVANGNWADRIGITPEEQRRRHDLLDGLRRGSSRLGDPGYRPGKGFAVARAPIRGTEPRHVDAAGSDGQHQPAQAAWQ
jgi:hypothetical protein